LFKPGSNDKGICSNMTALRQVPARTLFNMLE